MTARLLLRRLEKLEGFAREKKKEHARQKWGQVLRAMNTEDLTRLYQGHKSGRLASPGKGWVSGLGALAALGCEDPEAPAFLFARWVLTGQGEAAARAGLFASVPADYLARGEDCRRRAAGLTGEEKEAAEDGAALWGYLAALAREALED